MSVLQEQAVRMISGLSDENVSFLIEIIQRLMLPKSPAQMVKASANQVGIEAFQHLDAARKEIMKYLPEDFDPDKELEEARGERYGSID